MQNRYLKIQADAIRRYRIDLCDGTKCPEGDGRRTHAHVRKRRICKWRPKNSAESTFELFHEIGHIETGRGAMRRAEEEWAATVWAIDRFRELGMTVPPRTMLEYQRYILLEVSRGLRRRASGYPRMNLYAHAGLETPAQLMTIDPKDRWWCEPEALSVL